MTQSPISIHLSLIALVSFIVSCDRPETSPSIPTVPDEKIIEVPATDQLGAFESEVAHLAFWVHPVDAFNSAVIAANGAAGLIMINLEGNVVDTISGTFDHNIVVSYFSPDQAIDTLILSYDSEAQKTRAFTINPDGAHFEELTVNAFNGDAKQNLCLVRNGPFSLKLIKLRDKNALTLTDVTLTGEKEITLSPGQSVEISAATACTSDDRKGIVYIAKTGGQVLKLDLLAAPLTATPLFTLPEKNIAGLGVILQEENNAQLAVMTLDRGPLVYAYNLTTDLLDGAFIISAFDEIEAVQSVDAFAIGPDNYGTIYRAGAIAVVEGDATRALKLAPWSSVDSKLELNLPAPVNSRTLNIPAPAGPALDFDLTAPDDLLR